MNPTSIRHRLLREPLLHFIVFGALLFTVDHFTAQRRASQQVIEVGPDVEREARNIFRGALGHDPSPQEMQVLRARWVDNEVLYREGLALRVDQGDPAIRERVIFKALNVMQANLEVPKIDQQGLRAWFDKHHERYDEPARFDFAEAVLVGDTSPAAADRLVKALTLGVQGETQSGLRLFKARPRTNLVASYGLPFTEAMEKLAPGTWHALPSKEGVRVVRLEHLTPGESTSYDTVQSRIYQDWKDLTLQDMRTAAVRELGKKYTVSLAEQAK